MEFMYQIVRDSILELLCKPTQLFISDNKVYVLASKPQDFEIFTEAAEATTQTVEIPTVVELLYQHSLFDQSDLCTQLYTLFNQHSITGFESL